MQNLTVVLKKGEAQKQIDINCEKVKYGFFGNLEVLDKTAFSILAANIDSCSSDTVSNWKVEIETVKLPYGFEET